MSFGPARTQQLPARAAALSLAPPLPVSHTLRSRAVGASPWLATGAKSRSFGAMPAVQIRDVPSDVHEVLRRRARVAGQSLQEYLRSTLIAQARQPTLQEIFDEVERDPAPASAPLATTTALVRAVRDHP